MKQKFLFLALILFITAGAFADLIDQPVATIFLTKDEFITSMQLEQKMQQLRVIAQQNKIDLSNITRKKVLESLIDEILIYQGAERDGIKLTEEALDSIIRNLKANVEKQIGRPITEEEFKLLIKQQSGLSWTEYRNSIKNQTIQNEYIKMKKSDLIQSAPDPTKKQIMEAYDNNAQNLVNPKYIQISHIFISTINLDADSKAKALDNIKNIYKIYNKGDISFSKLAAEYSEDTQTKYKDGNIGFIAINDPNLKNTFGQKTFSTLFSMKEGEVQGILESKIGYHIFKVTKVIPPKMLILKDKVKPGSDITVSEYLKAGLLQEAQQNLLKKAVEELIQELRKDAEIIIMDPSLK